LASSFPSATEDRTCTDCRITKPLTEFFQRGGGARRKNCKSCSYKTTRQWALDNPSKTAIYNKRWYVSRSPEQCEIQRLRQRKRRAADPEKARAALRRWQKENRAKVNATSRKWREENSAWFKEYAIVNREKLREKERRTYRKSSAKAIARARRHQLLKKRAEPLWLTLDMQQAILAVYEEAVRLAKETGIPHHVDHIIPLNNSKVCGLHVPWNLQAIPASANMSKGNRLLFEGG